MLRWGKLLQICLLCYVLGVIWFFLFPAVCISTGELKPRGMYVDEHALLTTSIPFEKVNFKLTESKHRNETEMLALFELEGYEINVERSLYSFIIAPRNSPTGPEVSVLVFKMCGPLYQQWIIDVIVSISNHLRASRWMSKSVLVLIVTNGSDSYSHAIADWLRRYHLRTTFVDSAGHVQVSPQFHGLLRDALILDMMPCSVSLDENHDMKSPQGWPDGYELAFIGSNGQLPNMDMISAILSMQSKYITLRHDRALSLVFTDSGAGASAQSLGYSNYWDRLQGLFAFCRGLIMGPDGWHGHFLAHNIDSMTLKPLTGLSGVASNQKPTNRPTEATMGHFLSVIISVLRINSNLHEELHHSLFYYLVMGKWSFVGIQEYAPCLFLLCLPLLLCLWYVSRVFTAIMTKTVYEKVRKQIFLDHSGHDTMVNVDGICADGMWEGIIQGTCSVLGVTALLYAGKCVLGQWNSLAYGGAMECGDLRSDSTVTACTLFTYPMQYMASKGHSVDHIDITTLAIALIICYCLLIFFLAFTRKICTVTFLPSPSASAENNSSRSRGVMCGDIVVTLFIIVQIICIGVATRNFALALALAVIYGPMLVFASLITLSVIYPHSATFNSKRILSVILAVWALIVSPMALPAVIIFTRTRVYSDQGEENLSLSSIRDMSQVREIYHR